MSCGCAIIQEICLCPTSSTQLPGLSPARIGVAERRLVLLLRRLTGILEYHLVAWPIMVPQAEHTDGTAAPPPHL